MHAHINRLLTRSRTTVVSQVLVVSVTKTIRLASYLKSPPVKKKWFTLKTQ